jgi:hypothetical protein
MVFKVGETVVYPHHGAARIEEIKTRTIRGEEKLYLKLKVAQGDLVIEVPAENCDLVGVRDVVSKEGLDKVFEVLRTPYAEEPTNWSRRFKANLEKLASGDVIRSPRSCVTCGVVTRTGGCPPARSACSPRPGRSLSPSSPSPRRPTRRRPRPSSTRSSRPDPGSVPDPLT